MLKRRRYLKPSYRAAAYIAAKWARRQPTTVFAENLGFKIKLVDWWL